MVPWGDSKPETCKVYTGDMAVKSPSGKWFKSPRFVVRQPVLHNAVMTAAEFRTFPWNSGGVRVIPCIHDPNKVVVVWEGKQPIALDSGRVCLALQMFAEGNGDEMPDANLRRQGFCF